MGDILVIADAHDWRPANIAAAVAVVILSIRAVDVLAVVAQAQGVAGFMGAGLGTISRTVRFEDPDRRVTRPVKCADIRRASRPWSGSIGGSDDDVLAAVLRSLLKHSEVSDHVNVERQVVLGYPFPDILNFRVAEAGPLVGNASPRGCVATLEIEIDHRSSARQTLEHNDALVINRNGHAREIARVQRRDFCHTVGAPMVCPRQVKAKNISQRSLHQLRCATRTGGFDPVCPLAGLKVHHPNKAAGHTGQSLEEEPSSFRLR